MSAPVDERQLDPDLSSDAGGIGVREWQRILPRLAIALGLPAVIGVLFYLRIPNTFSGHTSIVGYPLYADFNADRYLDIAYYIGAAYPILALVIYVVLCRYGPLRRRTPKRKRPTDGPIPALTAEPPTPGVLGRLLLQGTVGLSLTLEFVAAFSTTRSDALAKDVLGACAYVALVNVLAALGRWVGRKDIVSTSSALNLIGASAALPLLWLCSQHTTMGVNGTTTHYPWFPLPAALVALGLEIAIAWACLRRWQVRFIERWAVLLVAVPVAIFVLMASLPNELGGMDAFGEGEFLGAAWLMLQGQIPWRDLYMIHGVLDDGLKGIVGLEIFGKNRWGVTAGLGMLFYPVYWISYYFFGVGIFRRRSAALVAATVTLIAGIFAYWDVRYIAWPLVLLLFGAVVRRPSLRRAVPLGFVLVLQALAIPEFTLAIPAVGLAVIACDVFERPEARLRAKDLVRTWGVALGGAVSTLAALIYFVSIGALGNVVEYYKDFASGHAITGAIPMFTNYSSTKLSTGIRVYLSAATPPLSRNAFDLWVPMAGVLVMFAIVVVSLRIGRRLPWEDWVGLAAALFVLVYFQKGVSRSDGYHLGEVMCVSAPLLFVLGAHFIKLLDRASAWLERRSAGTGTGRSLLGWALRRSPGALALVVFFTVVSPSAPAALAASASGAMRANSPVAAEGPVVPGGPGLGYGGQLALPPAVLTGLAAVFDRDAGAHGPVFDFSDAPGMTAFALNRKSGTNFYDVSLALTPSAQDELVSELAKSKPNVVLFDGFIGLYDWDFIPNEIREYLVSSYILAHYRPLEVIDGEHLFVGDWVKAPVTAKSETGYFSDQTCSWGYIPDFLNVPMSSGRSLTPKLKEIADLGSEGKIYRAIVPLGYNAKEQILQITRSKGGSVADLAVSNVLHHGYKDVPTHDIRWLDTSTTLKTDVDVSSCLQWHGYKGTTLYVRYQGSGSITSLRLLRS